jgi:hypothetical protein
LASQGSERIIRELARSASKTGPRRKAMKEDVKQLAREYLRLNPSASLHNAIKHTKKLGFEEKDVIIFSSEVFQQLCKRREVLKNVSRIWPEDKGY